MKLQESLNPWEPILLTHSLADRSMASSMPLEVAVIYQDTQTREWMRQTCARLTGQNPTVPMQSTWWKLDCLEDQKILQGAVKSAARAEVIMAAVYALDVVPESLIRWHEEWTTRRERQEGVLVAVIGTPESPTCDASVMRTFFKDIASQSSMHFMSQIKPVAEIPMETEPGLFSMLSPINSWVPPRHPSRVREFHDDWGINE